MCFGEGVTDGGDRTALRATKVPISRTSRCRKNDEPHHKKRAVTETPYRLAANVGRRFGLGKSIVFWLFLAFCRLIPTRICRQNQKGTIVRMKNATWPHERPALVVPFWPSVNQERGHVATATEKFETAGAPLRRAIEVHASHARRWIPCSRSSTMAVTCRAKTGCRASSWPTWATLVARRASHPELPSSAPPWLRPLTSPPPRRPPRAACSAPPRGRPPRRR